MSSANFTPITARPTFGSNRMIYYGSDYILNKKIKNMFCNKQDCLKLNKVNNQSDLLLLNKAIKYNTFKSFNRANLNVNLITKLDLNNVNVVENTLTGDTPTTIDIDITFNQNYTIDPSGVLFGNDLCGINNYVNFQELNC
jgi:hypothetical protein